MPTPVLAMLVAAGAPAFAPMALDWVEVVDGVVLLAGGAVAAPATPPVVLGVLVADGAPLEVCPAMLASPEALL